MHVYLLDFYILTVYLLSYNECLLERSRRVQDPLLFQLELAIPHHNLDLDRYGHDRSIL